MEKRGQVTIFIIIGIVILAIVILFLFLKETIYIGPTTPERLQEEFPEISDHVEECLIDTAKESIILIGKQGGYIDTPRDTYRTYDDTKISFLCYNIENSPLCRNRMLTKQDLQNQIAGDMEDPLSACIDIDKFKKAGYTITAGRLDLTVDMGLDNIALFLDFPITIKKDQVEVEESKFSANLDYPLGRLYDTSQDILDLETTVGTFETSVYAFRKTQITGKQYVLQRLTPYPDKLYILKIKETPSKDEEYIFQFFVQDEERS